jgi:type VI secretion system protein ImpK
MSTNDPFGPPGNDRTVIVPSPGGRQPAPQRATAAASVEPPAALFELGANPLLAAANPLLNMVPQLRATLQHPDPSGLRDAMAQSIRQFETRAKAAGVASEKVIAARYALCTLLDETVASTPWGGSGLWAKQSLLIMFHNEAWGGEKFFQLLAKLAENPGANRDLLELLYVCLALGFEGRYRVIENGRQQLEALRERLAQLLRNQRGEYERDLSPHWRGFTTKRSPVLESLRLWVVAAVAALVLAAVYFTLNLSLNRMSDPVFAAIQGIRVQAPAARQAPAAKPRLAGFLKPEIDAGLVAVRDEENRSVITIRGDGFFEPGSATVAEKVRPLLGRIAEGRADAEPVAPNDTPANRARNRRVEITLFVVRQG